MSQIEKEELEGELRSTYFCLAHLTGAQGIANYGGYYLKPIRSFWNFE